MILRSIVTMAALLLAGSCGGTPEGPTNPDPAVATFTSAHFAFRYPRATRRSSRRLPPPSSANTPGSSTIFAWLPYRPSR